MNRARLIASAAVLAVLSTSAACRTADPEAVTGAAESLVVYSGRNESLVGPLLERFESDTGIEVEVRYGGTSELAATILEEGDKTPADVFLSQDAAALGALSGAGRFRAARAAAHAAVEHPRPR